MIKFIVLLYVCLIVTYAHAWENKVTHRVLSEKAAALSLTDEMLSKEFTLFGKKQSAKVWIQDGAELEDSGSIFKPGTARYRNHFHNPLANMTPPVGALTDGGLTDAMTGQSAVLWAQDKNNQKNFDQGDWSWPTVRDHYYSSLTGTTQADIDAFTAKTYLGLGYQMHLLQDMGQPDHVRNDAHPIDGSGYLWGFETWAKKKFDLIQRYATTATKPTVDLTQPFYDGYSPVARLMDTREYKAATTPSVAMSQGLSEYTNANFFSDNTIFAARFAANDKHYFPFPRKEGTDVQSYFNGTKAAETVISEDGKAVKGLWISKAGEGETVPHLVRVGAMAKLAYNVFGEGARFYSALGRDEITYEDYAQKLVPRSVGYSAALLDYFFRGKIKLEIAGTDNSNSLIHLKATNDTANNEQMPAGDVSLVLRYRMIQTNDQPSSIMEGGNYEYKVFPYSGQSAIPTGTGTEFTFNIPPLPDWANDVTAQLVYRGQLGKEAGAVAVGSLPIKVKPKAILISLPDSGAYAVSDGTHAFKQITIKAKTELPNGLNAAGGVFQLILIHRFSAADPYQGTEVGILPVNQNSYYAIRANEQSGINSLSTGVAKELTFDISATPVPLVAADVHVYLVYKANQNDPDTSALAVGYLDISEPTPIDVYNNTDKICLNGTWYAAGSAAAVAFSNLTDVYPHRISNIYYQPGTTNTASSSNFLLSSTANLEPGSGKRLGYILTDYYFSQSTSETVIDLDSRDTWELTYSNVPTAAEGFVNQHNMGNMQGYSGMYNMRGYKMHGGAGVVFDNQEYPEGMDCSWDLLNQPPTP